MEPIDRGADTVAESSIEYGNKKFDLFNYWVINHVAGGP